ncbi:MAG TPA: TonB-dependent receptor [Candidatus Bacteroides merdigallinarum]|uniref:TonB-dependent receptor n=1 Tax=Candidatus Bacteroides merdigallinarum TaxID=2838473 RepID=A0A9D2J0A2_9BACE|nr:TonB-dependent receptor [Candidatus Bacteroides merdigallinarum]
MLKGLKSISALLLCCAISGGTVYATPSERQVSQANQQQDGTCTGVVVDETGMTVIGASVVVKGTSNGAITDLDGKFVIKNAKPGDVIVITYVGYSPVEVTWNGQPLNITLKEDSELLDEVVVVGYGVQKKVNVTGAVSMVESEVLESRPVANVQQALQGQIAGLNLTVGNSGGELGQSMSINIRGAGTIGSGSTASPLVLIDGMEGDMNALNPSDIANISVLKDASSASIYGARAAFGVILITTKSGQSGKPHVNYSGNVRFYNTIGVPDVANSYDFAQMFNAADRNNGSASVTFSNEYLQNIRDYMDGKLTASTVPNQSAWAKWNEGAYDNVNWIKEFFKTWSDPSQEHNISVSGGSDKMQYFFSGNFLDQRGALNHGKDTYRRYTLNGKFTAELADWIKFTYSTRWTRSDYDRPTYMSYNGLFFHNVSRKWPIQPAYDPNGYPMNESEIQQMESGGVRRDQTDIYSNQLSIVIEPIKDWHINLEGNIRTNTQYQHQEILPVYYWDVEGNPQPMDWTMGETTYPAGTSRVTEYNYRENYYSTNIYSDYSKTFDSGHYFKVMAGFNAEKYTTRSITGRRDDLVTPNVPTINTALSNDYAAGEFQHNAVVGFFGRVNYAYKDRYMAEFNARYDGSSRFVGDKRWGFFPSFSAGWNIAREPFFEDLSEKTTITTLKLRGSWGELGNTATSSWYPFYQVLDLKTNYGWFVNGSTLNYVDAPGLVSSALTWETIRSWDIGLDFGLLNGRLNGSFGYFVRKTLDMVGPAPELSSLLGADVPRVNNCDLKSYGFELELGWRDDIGDFSYGVKFNLSDAQQEVTRYPNASKTLTTDNSAAYYDGAKLGDIWGYTTIGIAQTDEQMQEHLSKVNQSIFGSGWGAGDIMYADLDGNGRITRGDNTADNPGDRRVIGNSTPRYNYGITLDAAWKGFDLRLFFQGVGKRDLWLGGTYFWGTTGGMWQSNVFEEHLDYWRTDNPGAYYPRPRWSDNNKQVQTGYLQNGAYCRLKNLTLGYTFPKAWTQKAGIENLRLYFSADNLFTFTSLSDIFDPEATGGNYGGVGNVYPLQRVLSVGVNINF